MAFKYEFPFRIQPHYLVNFANTLDKIIRKENYKNLDVVVEVKLIFWEHDDEITILRCVEELIQSLDIQLP